MTFGNRPPVPAAEGPARTLRYTLDPNGPVPAVRSFDLARGQHARDPD
jgi:hypothetical protein